MINDNHKDHELSILLIDDDEDEYILLKELIRKSTYKGIHSKIQLEWVSSYECALNALQHKTYDASLVDYRLGEHSGLELLQEINQRDLKTPVILLTGQGNYDVDLAAMQQGAADYLIKGQVDAPLLERTIRYAIEHKKAQEELEQRVRERTAELEQANRGLHEEVIRRRQVERELRATQARLEERVLERTAALSEANQWLQAVFNHISEAVTVYDEHGQMLKANQVAMENRSLMPDLSNVSPTESGCPALQLRYPDGSLVEAEENPVRRALRGQVVRQEPFRYTQPQGHTAHLLISATPMYANGQLSGVVMVAHDITEREQLMAQLATEQNRLQTIIENTASGIVVADQTGSVIIANPVAVQILGQPVPLNQPYSSQEHLGICYPDGTPYPTRRLMLTRAALDGETFANVEMQICLPDREETRTILSSATPIFDSRGKRNGAVWVFHDITSRKAMEANLQNQASRAQLLSVLSRAFAEAGLNDRAVLDTITHQIAERVGDACILRLVSDDGQWLEPVSFYANHPAAFDQMRKVFASYRHRANEGPSALVLRTGEPLLVPEVSLRDARALAPQEYWEWLERYAVRSLLVVPLKIKDRPIGTLMLMRIASGYPQRDAQAYTLEDLRFFEDLAGRAALAVENAKLYEEVQRLSVTDPLTGLYNRRGLMALAEAELRRAHRLRQPVAVILVDIDHFKQVNDTFGHPTGDEVLRVVSTRLQQSLRSEDILARYGGEEFAVLVPDCSISMASQRGNAPARSV